MQRNRKVGVALAAASAVLLAGPSASAQHGGGHEAHAPATPAKDQPTMSLQGNDAAAWIADPHVHAFYDLAVADLGHGKAATANVESFEQASFAVFRDFGTSKGVPPEAMQDHLKAIPRQMVDIVKADPKAVESYDNFVEALFGPP